MTYPIHWKCNNDGCDNEHLQRLSMFKAKCKKCKNVYSSVEVIDKYLKAKFFSMLFEHVFMLTIFIKPNLFADFVYYTRQCFFLLIFMIVTNVNGFRISCYGNKYITQLMFRMLSDNVIYDIDTYESTLQSQSRAYYEFIKKSMVCGIKFESLMLTLSFKNNNEPVVVVSRYCRR